MFPEAWNTQAVVQSRPVLLPQMCVGQSRWPARRRETVLRGGRLGTGSLKVQAPPCHWHAPVLPCAAYGSAFSAVGMPPCCGRAAFLFEGGGLP